MYTFIRRIHLFAGLLLLVFVLMYFLSGYVLIHEPWFGGREPRTSVRTEPLASAGMFTDEAMSLYLQQAFNLRGQRSPANHRADGSVRFGFAHPGTAFEALVAAGGKQVTITRKDFGFGGLANGFHRLRGYHGGWLYVLWALLYDLASAALIVFAITGIVLWHQSTARRLPGWLCLGASFGFTAVMVLYLMFSL